jgi:hypothetical protein
MKLQGAPVDAVEVIPVAPNFLKAEDIRELIAGIGAADLIVVDTFAQVTPGANENASEDMGRALGHCRVLHRETGATIVLVHHSGKDATKGARGWSGLKAAADAELEVTRLDEARFIRVTKQKDGEDGDMFPFKLVAVSLGEDEDGEPIRSAVVEHTDVLPVKGGRRRKPDSAGDVVLRVVQDLTPPTGGMVEVSEVLEAAIRGLTYNPTRRDQRRVRALRAVERLVGDGWLVAENNKVGLLRVT